MESIQSLKLGFRHNESNIVAIESSPSLIINRKFYEKMGEQEDLKSCPVKIMAIHADWLLSEKEGQKFLKTMLAIEDMDLYRIEAV